MVGTPPLLSEKLVWVPENDKNYDVPKNKFCNAWSKIKSTSNEDIETLSEKLCFSIIFIFSGDKLYKFSSTF